MRDILRAMKFLSFILLFTISLCAFSQDSCLEYASDQIEVLQRRNFVHQETVLAHLEDNLYFNCRLGFSSKESWFCVDKKMKNNFYPSKAVHFNTKLHTWYEASLGSTATPEVNFFRQDPFAGHMGRFNHYKLSPRYKVMIEKNSSDRDRLNGIKIDNRVTFERKFVNITCYSVSSLLQN